MEFQFLLTTFDSQFYSEPEMTRVSPTQVLFLLAWSRCSREILNAILAPAVFLVCVYGVVMNGAYKCGNGTAETLIENVVLHCIVMFKPTC